MILASAYPSSDIPAGAMIAIAVVMAAVLAFWIVMVYRADSQPGHPAGTAGQRHAVPPAPPERTTLGPVTEDGDGEAGARDAGHPKGAAV